MRILGEHSEPPYSKVQQNADDFFGDLSIHAACHGLLDLTTRPWIHRAWVVQEVFAAKSKKVHIGPEIIEWDAFLFSRKCIRAIMSRDRLRSAEEILVRAGVIRTKVEEFIAPLTYLAGVYTRYNLKYSSFNLGDLLLRVFEDSTHLQASDDRDRVYALLGIADFYARKLDLYPKAPAMPRIDYRLSTSEVYQKIACFIMECQNSLKLLYVLPERKASDVPQHEIQSFKQSALTHRYGYQSEIHRLGSRRSREELKLPSWTPDWRSLTIEDEAWNKLIAYMALHCRTQHHYSSPLQLHGMVYATIRSISKVEDACDNCSIRRWRQKANVAITPAFHEAKEPIRELAESSSRRHASLQSFSAFRSLPTMYYDCWEEDGLTTWFVPENACIDDLLVFVHGGSLPLLLRRLDGRFVQFQGYAQPFDSHLRASSRNDVCRYYWDFIKQCGELLRDMVDPLHCLLDSPHLMRADRYEAFEIH